MAESWSISLKKCGHNFDTINNSPVLQFGAPPAIDLGDQNAHCIMGKCWLTNAAQYEIIYEHVSNGLKMWVKRLHTEIPQYNNNLH